LRRATVSATPAVAELRAALQALPLSTFTATADGRIDWVSDRWYDATGIARDAVLGEAWVHVVHPEDIEQVVWLWTRALESGTPWEATPRVRHADGNYRQWFTRAELFTPAAGTPVWIGTTVELPAVPLTKTAARQDEPEPA